MAQEHLVVDCVSRFQDEVSPDFEWVDKHPVWSQNRITCRLLRNRNLQQQVGLPLEACVEHVELQHRRRHRLRPWCPFEPDVLNPDRRGRLRADARRVLTNPNGRRPGKGFVPIQMAAGSALGCAVGMSLMSPVALSKAPQARVNAPMMKTLALGISVSTEPTCGAVSMGHSVHDRVDTKGVPID